MKMKVNTEDKIRSRQRRMTLNLQNNMVNKNYRDRFIPNRSLTNSDVSGYLVNTTHRKDIEIIDILQKSQGGTTVNTTRYIHQRKIYRHKLWLAMFNNEPQHRVLNFSSNRSGPNPEPVLDCEYSWPVRARPKPLLRAPVTILDMPDLDTNICHNVIDWSSNGFLTTIHEGRVLMYNPDTSDSANLDVMQNAKYCIKWNSEGTLLAVGIALPISQVLVWDFTVNKVLCDSLCPCLVKPACSATALQWKGSSKYLIMGCTEGTLTVFDVRSGSIVLTRLKAHDSDIISIQFSSKENYYVTSGLDRKVKVWMWLAPTNCLENWKYSAPIKAISWHPWKNSLLVHGLESSMILTDLNQKRQVRKKHERENVSVDCMTFNPESAELLVSYSTVGINYLTVLKDLNTVVDEVQYHTSPVPYLLWDCTGCKLATASGDENLCIWNFLGEGREIRKYFSVTKKRKFTTNVMDTIDMIGPTIR